MAGIRDSKTVDGVEYNYLTLDGKVVRQTWGSNVLDIIYDNSGLPYALKYNGGYYIYVLNQQGDVIRIVNSTGATVAEYRYDAWGNVIYSSGSMAAINPLRYRGYYYDAETGFYYLQSRYYDPSIGRFINADTLASTGQGFLGYNMFAYCNNNPVTGYDPNGNINWSNVIKGVAIVAAVTVAVAATVATAGAFAVTAGVVSSTVATAATVGSVVGGVASGVTELAIQCVTTGTDNLNYGAIGIETFVGSAHGSFDGALSTLSSVTGRLLCRGGKVLVGGLGAIFHSVNQGKGFVDTMIATGKALVAGTAIQFAMGRLDILQGKNIPSTLESYLLDGALKYGTKQMLVTAATRVGSNMYRNKNNFLELAY